MSFSDRFGYETAAVPRVNVECDSPALRLVLWNAVSSNGKNMLAAYQSLCEHAQQLPDPSVWSEQYARERALSVLDDLNWIEVYEAIEAEVRDARGQRRVEIERAVNKALARGGLAYELRQGAFEFYEPAAIAFSTSRNEDEPLTVLVDEFAPVHKQYESALRNLRSRPADLESAVADAVNALEAVAKIVGGRPQATLSDVARTLFPESPGYHAPLRSGIEKLYAYSNQVPGVRHGRYAEPVIAHAESVMVVRLAGALITFLITIHQENAGSRPL